MTKQEVKNKIINLLRLVNTFLAMQEKRDAEQSTARADNETKPNRTE